MPSIGHQKWKSSNWWQCKFPALQNCIKLHHDLVCTNYQSIAKGINGQKDGSLNHTHTLQGTSKTSSTNPSNIMKQIDANAALYSTSHCTNQILEVSNSAVLRCLKLIIFNESHRIMQKQECWYLEKQNIYMMDRQNKKIGGGVLLWRWEEYTMTWRTLCLVNHLHGSLSQN